MEVLNGQLTADGATIGIVVARFNGFITKQLLAGAIDGLSRHGVSDDAIHVAWVPGAFEIPLIANKMATSGKYNAVIALGAVIRGATDHYEYVAGEMANGIANASVTSGVPVIFGVLTTDTIEQAIERAGTKAGNKGYSAAETALEMISLIRALDAE